MKKIAAVYLTLSLWAVNTFGQVNNGLLTTLSAIAGMRDRMPIEKLYLQLDKPYYAIGDTLRFKAYLLNGDLLKPSKRSSLFYVELIDDSSQVVKRQTLMLRNGTSWGDIVCKKAWHAGNYTLRAYTNWMRNVGEAGFFTRQVGIVPAGSPGWLVNNHLTVDKDKNVNLALRFSDLTHRNIGFHDMQLSVLHGTSVLLKNKERTGPEGNLDFKFIPPEKLTIERLSLLAEDISKDGGGKKVVIPIQLNRPENTDLQFMPEGGNMVAGTPIKIGFKAIGEDGKGTAVAGKIVNSKQQDVCSFQSTHNGMGAFMLTPQAGESYSAKVTLPGNIDKSYPLPAVNAAGTVLRIDPKGRDSLEVSLSATADLVNKPDNYYLIGQTRGIVCYSSIVNFKQGGAIKKVIATNLFPAGIAHFTFLTGTGQPLNERICYIDHKDNLQIALNTNKPGYVLRDSVGLNVQVKDKDGKPIRGLFSMAVTDDSQVNIDSLANNILTSVLLTSDLKGTVEDPAWYFEGDNKATALDNLLLTQGWIGYDWKQVFAPPVPPEYEAEKEFKVKGRATNVLGLPINNTSIMLISTRPQLFMNTTTGKDGRFTFSGFPLLDTISFHLQPMRTFNVGLTADEFVPPEFTPLKTMPMPWYINSDTTMVSYINKKQAEYDEAFDAGKSKMLKEVLIKGKKVEPPPPPILNMNEEDIRNARPGKKPLTLLKMLEQRVKIDGMQLVIILDGAPVLSQRGPYYVSPFYWLYQYVTEDIKSFSVSMRKDDKGYFLLIYVTSNFGRRGMGVISGTQGYAYRPMPISWPHNFYSPRYTVATTPTGKDRRSTIFWEPNVVTDAYGKAALSFFSADQPGTYTVIIEGTDMNGSFGYSRQKIKVVKK